ncbi:hypothetical protein ABTK61_19370, partial [Acinetobacter baumannii]
NGYDVVFVVNSTKILVYNSGQVTPAQIGTGTAGTTDGIGSTAQFAGLNQITRIGNVFYICDSAGQKVRQIVLRPGASPLSKENWVV